MKNHTIILRSIIISVITLAQFGCGDPKTANPGTTNVQNVKDDQLSIETVTAFHCFLNEICQRHNLYAVYLGPLTRYGRAMVLGGDFEGYAPLMSTWSIYTAVSVSEGVPELDFTPICAVTITRIDSKDSFMRCEVNGIKLALLVEPSKGVSVDEEIKGIEGKSTIRKVLGELDKIKSRKWPK